tara:strand:- start:994 stop:1416 length:423 start_codon:yes stop_codon:yes gene_type:complete
MATTRFRGPVLQGKFNEGSVTGYNLNQKTAAYSVLIGDSGSTFTCPKNDTTAGASVVFTLPTVAANEGSTFTFVNTGADGQNQVQVTGAGGAEYIAYKGVVNQLTLTNTLATSKVGDYVTVSGNRAGTEWTIMAIQGVWA